MTPESMDYENPLRPNYELQATTVWFFAAFVSLAVHFIFDMPRQQFFWMLSICTVMAMFRLPPAIKLAKMQHFLKGRPLEFIKLKELARYTDKDNPQLWLGNGFIWENRHAQLVFEILKRDWSKIVPAKKNKGVKNNAKQKGKALDEIGQRWIHGIESKEHVIYQPLTHSEGQNLILGTTGAGKTRMFDLFISQAIMRGESVIIIDPKGDKELADNARRACEFLGCPDKFVYFHPAFPERSVRIDTLRNYNRPTEIPTRLATLIGSEAESDPFKAFSWQALNNITQALIMSYERPSIITLKRFLETGPHEMVVRALYAYADRHLKDGKLEAQAYLAKKNVNMANFEKMAREMANFYREFLLPVAPSPELDALISMSEHDRTHFSKMVASLLPILNMLTAGEIGKLLSPDYSDINDRRPITDIKKIIANQQVLYIGLDSLTDKMVGSAIGSLALAEAVAVAGDRYNYGVDNQPVNIFVDEAAEVINEPTIQLLNKGRGAVMKMFIASQTIADFVARLGSQEKAEQVLGNINNVYALRCINPETQKFITDTLPKTRVKYVNRTQGSNSDPNAPLLYNTSIGESLREEEAELFNPQLLGMLPNLEYIAKISGGLIVKGRLPILTN